MDIRSICLMIIFREAAKQQQSSFQQLIKLCNKSACVLLGRNEAIRRSSEIKSFVDEFVVSKNPQDVYKKAFRKFIYSLGVKCFKDINGIKAKGILTRIKNELATQDDMAYLKNADMYKIELVDIVGSGDFKLNADEEMLMNGLKKDAELSNQDKIKIIPHPNPIFGVKSNTSEQHKIISDKNENLQEVTKDQVITESKDKILNEHNLEFEFDELEEDDYQDITTIKNKISENESLLHESKSEKNNFDHPVNNLKNDTVEKVKNKTFKIEFEIPEYIMPFTEPAVLIVIIILLVIIIVLYSRKNKSDENKITEEIKISKDKKNK